MKICFIGGLYYSDDYAVELQSDSPTMINIAAHKFQWNLIKGLDCHFPGEITILTNIFVGSFPHNLRKIFVKGKKWSHDKFARDKSFAFINLPIIKPLNKMVNVLFGLVNWCYENRAEQKVVIVYSLYSPFIIPCVLLKKICSNTKICLVVPDLPNNMYIDANTPIFNKFKQFFNTKITKLLIKYADSFVFLTESMNNLLNKKRVPYIVVEGIVDVEDANTFVDYQMLSNDILYTGALFTKYGIIELLEAFVKTSYFGKFIVCGGGEKECIDKIMALEKKDERIEYKGIVNREQALLFQKNAGILVNPRNDLHEFTKYSFPSKTMEYLLTGKPVVMFKLAGVSEEYSDYIYYPDRPTYSSFVDKLIEVSGITVQEKVARSIKTLEFLEKNKSVDAQGFKLVKLFTTLFTSEKRL
ncbi:MAG: glycosyltransferase [Bacillota bacterium]